MFVCIAWLYRLFNYGIGIHLLKDDECNQKPKSEVSAADINPRSDHVSFQVSLFSGPAVLVNKTT